MIIETMHALASAAPLAVETSDDGGGGAFLALLLAGPAGGVGFYILMYRHYRNTDKSHGYERETLVEVKPIAGRDTKIGENNGTRSSRIKGGNASDHRERVARF